MGGTILGRGCVLLMGQGTNCDLVDNNCHQGSQRAAERVKERVRGGQKAPPPPSLPPPLSVCECPAAHVTAISLNGALCKMEMILASGVVIGRIAG